MMRQLVFILLLSGLACNRQKSAVETDTPTSGSIVVAVDESLTPLLQAEQEAFHALYEKAHIEMRFVSEAKAIELLLNDSVRMAVVTRKLTKEEEEVIKSRKISPRHITVAKEGVAIIAHKSNPDSTLTWMQLRDLIALGKYEDMKTQSPRVVFDEAQSGVVRYIKDSLLQGKPFAKNSFAAGNSKALVDYVADTKNTFGLIGSSWISDTDDSTTVRFLKKIQVVSISKDEDAYQPYQAYIAQKVYPLARSVIVISQEPRSGLGTGFVSFMSGDLGQRIVLKAGMVPAKMPLRVVSVKRGNITN